jgi:hypothetical protein
VNARPPCGEASFLAGNRHTRAAPERPLTAALLTLM